MHVDSRGLAGWPAASVLLVVGSLLVIALSYLVAMLRRVEAGAPFAAARQLRGFARFLFLSVLASVLLPPLILLALGTTTPGEQRITFALAGSDLLTLFVTGLLYFVSRLLDDAQRVADDFKPDRLRPIMGIIVRLDVMLALRKAKSKDLAAFLGITETNLSLLKSGRVKGVRFETLDGICRFLQCQPGDLLVHDPDREAEPEN
jgi:putative transcriptional regulator